MNIFIVEPYGWCSGVKKSIALAEEILSKKGEVYTLGALVHNPQVIKELAEKGIKMWDSNETPYNKRLIVRAHGLPQEDIEKHKLNNNEVFDATCPLVKKVQKLAEFLTKNGYKVIIIGERQHPEVIGIMSYTQGKGCVVEDIEDAEYVKSYPNIGIVFQTTQSWEGVQEILKIILGKGKEIRIFNTICPETEERQNKAKTLSEMVDIALVLGGKNSANTRRLYEILQKKVISYYVERVEEIKKDWFEGKNNVGIITGTSTPNSFVEEVLKVLREWYPLEIHLV
ncbi:MAG TPA: 4-hydroxy-3-methylbut-2-enyl diphosphate reductase [Dictyoglomaceae bacterium]|nr:4-hydroxy-3-methylbut-2-enyl diphosphate reductase [Dictyoglomaceae bacterium]HOL40007.1 4-hydroxy-3-methylbut-2-enyl diphosphate reductase [Dictyoglomaceae bacterium]HPP15588.1 4-hydroxy-3-methylbut-2-enyl diphosphate reductase [Dictyoglomaceae bacterium]